jgi:hypothetical protein
MPSQFHPIALAGLCAALGLSACARAAEAPDDESSLVARPAPEAGGTADAGGNEAEVPVPSGGDAAAGGSDAGTAQSSPRDAGSDAGAAPRDAGGLGPAADGAVSECVAGTYRGVFAGNVQFLPGIGGLLGLLSADITGTLEITVEADALGSVLIAKNGKVHGTDQDGNPVDADLTGSLDCTTKKLVNGKLVNGKYVRSGLINTSFSGTISGNYSADPPSASGTWETSAGVLEGGGGTWSATLVP